MGPFLVLASSSPRRFELLTQNGFSFEVVAPAVDERCDAALTLRELATWNALRKGFGVARTHPDKVILAADTLVALHGEIIGKPRDRAEAARILRRLSGNVHEVCSAVFLGHLALERTLVFQDVSHVRFKRLSREEIDRYIDRVNPLDKAGAYAAQGEGGKIIEQIDGSYSNVVGLPMEQSIPALRRFGIAAKPPNESQPRPAASRPCQPYRASTPGKGTRR
jgi:septum formation protein